MYDAATATYERYTRLYNAMTEKYRERIYQAHPEVTRPYAFHCAHNWGNEAARRELERYQRRSSALCKRQSREFRKAEHNARHNDGWRPFYCEYCQS